MSNQALRVFEVIQRTKDRLIVQDRTVAILDTQGEANKVAESLKARTDFTYTVRDRKV